MYRSRASHLIFGPITTAAAIVGSIVGTGYLALLVTFIRYGGWDGYAAGLGDHTVLFPQGIQWAIPNAFKNDWFLAAAPQPHWFFDVIVYLGTATGTIDALLLTYWLLGIAAFATATVLAAQQWTSRFSWAAVFCAISIAGALPWGLFGTAPGTVGMALPTVLSVNLLYLSIVLLLRRNYTIAASLGVVISIVHVQQASIVVVIFAALTAVLFHQQRKLNWPLTAGFLASAGFMVLGLKLRPVAANLRDFVEVCNTIIPYHCAAHSWTPSVKMGVLGGLILATLTVFALTKPSRLIWYPTVGLIILGYTLGFTFDSFQVPVLGELAQAVNVYRLGSIIAPFAVWGLLLPFLNIRMKRKAPLWAIWTVSVFLLFQDSAWAISRWFQNAESAQWVFLLLGGATLIFVAFFRPSLFKPVLGALLATVILASSFFVGSMQPAPRLNWVHHESPYQEWMTEVRDVVPVGATIVANPLQGADIRLLTQRAIVGDCKNVPYGGDAWSEWQQRTADLGGCTTPTYIQLPIEHFEEIGSKYNAQYVVIPTGKDEVLRQEALERAGWKLLVPENSGVEASLYELPVKSD